MSGGRFASGSGRGGRGSGGRSGRGGYGGRGSSGRGNFGRNDTGGASERKSLRHIRQANNRKLHTIR